MIDSRRKRVRMFVFRSNDLEQYSSPPRTLIRFSHFRQVSVSISPKKTGYVNVREVDRILSTSKQAFRIIGWALTTKTSSPSLISRSREFSRNIHSFACSSVKRVRVVKDRRPQCVWSWRLRRLCPFAMALLMSSYSYPQRSHQFGVSR